jgi:hypothetical protein
MDPAIPELSEDVKKMLAIHEVLTANLRAELLQRSAGEVLYDDYLIAELRRGRSFKRALQNANAQFPSEALSPENSDLADCEEHYRSILRMEDIDQHRIELEECRKKLRKVDAQICETVESVSNEKQDSGCPPSADRQ